MVAYHRPFSLPILALHLLAKAVFTFRLQQERFAVEWLLRLLDDATVCSTFGPPRNRPGDGVLPNQEYTSCGFDNYQNTALLLCTAETISNLWNLH